ncbi:nitrogen regulation protein NR(I) [Castellaniella sp. S9]|uniref:nitrogen regulation protein NR(I) n=1 Tax=Castellaniella sp. S9 TaxID=2993652 RepID=UPI0022B55B47|nr:nitrogen regulation protein NR(I) [Castellaniella sp. S9]
MNPVWIVDDEKTMRWVLEKALDKEGLPVRGFSDGVAALDAFDAGERPSVVLTDVRMPGRDGLSLMAEIKARAPDIPVIVMTAFTDLDTTVAAFQHGAFDYLAKPFDVEAAVLTIRRAAREQSDAGPLAGEAARGMLMPSHAPAMQEVFRAMGRLAASKATVLITGESGTGKELIARALHQHSRRAAGPFIAVNAAAIPRDLLEAELFGHERGAFTGAVQTRRGRFEEARGGTLFLDEIGDMPAELQTRLLRVLAEGSFYRVGGTQALAVDVRVVAATHQPLERRVAQGLFREDLFHRLNVIRLRLPPLRERREDIAALAAHFLRTSAAELGVPARTLGPDALATLERFDYPGNIRQLENICQWLTVMAPSQTVERHDLPPEVLEAAPATAAEAGAGRAGTDPSEGRQGPGWAAALAEDARRRLGRQEPCVMDTLAADFERAVIGAALAYSGGRRGEAARRLGIGRNTLARKCRELGLDAGGGEA